MSNLSQNLLSILIGGIFGGFGGLMVLIFWPLLFPLSLQGSSWGEDAIVIALPVVFLTFALSGFLLCRRLTSRYVREHTDNKGRVQFR
jgi:hypothetical protein